MDDNRAIVERFVTAASAEFSFLVPEYGFEQQEPRLPQDWARGECSVPFFHPARKLGVNLYFDLEIWWIGVALFHSPSGELHKFSVWGQVQWDPGIVLSALVELETGDEKLAYALPFSFPNLSFREQERRRLARRETIVCHGIDNIVHQYALLLRRFGESVLLGDISNFPEVQKFYRRRMCAALSRDGRDITIGSE